MHNARGWISNNVLLTVLIILAIVAVLVFLIINVDVNVKG